MAAAANANHRNLFMAAPFAGSRRATMLCPNSEDSLRGRQPHAPVPCVSLVLLLSWASSMPAPSPTLTHGAILANASLRECSHFRLYNGQPRLRHRVACGKTHAEHGSNPFLALRFYACVMGAGNALCQGQSQSVSFAALHQLRPIKALENVRQVRRANTHTGILHRGYHLCARRFRRYPHFASGI